MAVVGIDAAGRGTLSGAGDNHHLLSAVLLLAGRSPAGNRRQIDRLMTIVTNGADGSVSADRGRMCDASAGAAPLQMLQRPGAGNPGPQLFAHCLGRYENLADERHRRRWR